METILAIAAGLLFVFISDKLDKKKPKAKRPHGERPFPRSPGPVKLPPPMPQPWPKDTKQKQGKFDIPPIQGAPPVPSGQDGVYREAGTQIQSQAEAYHREVQENSKYRAYLEKKQETEAKERAAEQAAYQQGAKIPGTAGKRPVLELQPQAMLNAVIYAELLGRPKAQRRRNPYFRK